MLQLLVKGIFWFLLVFGFSINAYAGYTHYWQWRTPPDKDTLRVCIKEIEVVLEQSGEIVAGPDGTGQPIVTEESVALNGIADLSHETFVFPGENLFNFCKTEYKPYSAVVVACLLVAADHFPREILEIYSDGQWDTGDWELGASIYSASMQRKPESPLVDGLDIYNERENNMLIYEMISMWPFIVGIILIVYMNRKSHKQIASRVENEKVLIETIKKNHEMSKEYNHRIELLLNRIAGELEAIGSRGAR